MSIKINKLDKEAINQPDAWSRFKINHIQVDVTRCTLNIEGEKRTIEPRVMDVLVYLSQRRGEVCSSEEIFSALWPDITFSQGSVQRCIAQLRKALDDNASRQALVVTYPKRGYSLEADISPVKLESSQAEQTSTRPWLKNPLGPIALLIAMSTIFVIPLVMKKSSPYKAPVSITSRAMTQSHGVEIAPVYHPGGEFIAFIRQPNKQTSQIWLKHLNSAQEHLIAESSDTLLSIDWRPDGTQLGYIESSATHYHLGTLELNIDAPVRSSLIPQVTMPKQGFISKLLWADDEHWIYSHAQLAVNQPALSKVYHYDISTGQQSILLASDASFSPYRLALSPDKKRLAIAGQAPDNKVELRTFLLSNQTLSAPIIELPLGLIEIDWHPSQEHILLNHSEGLSLVSLSGQKSNLPLLNHGSINHPRFHPTKPRLLLSMIQQDSDLWLWSIAEKAPQKLTNSTAFDSKATLSNQQASIAYISKRNGVEQLFIHHNNHTKRLFENKRSAPLLSAPIWSPDDSTIALLTPGELLFFDVTTGNHRSEVVGRELTALIGWYFKENALLLHQQQNTHASFVKRHIASGRMTEVALSGEYYRAQLDHQDQLWLQQENSLIKIDAALKKTKVSINEITNNFKALTFFSTDKGFIYQKNNEVYLRQHLIFSSTALPLQLLDVSQDGRLFLLKGVESSRSHLIELNLK
ncbi:winged helix-turn-helix domain-containing protein [Pleionea sp. CnH1-48]|uniref:winged helix-turn-helix domain-containing protein n=1 Tax=Pleionea sp. CnH1-48 TaxID=2954494 RepID=UPI002096CC7D|nr:winged helix-turn-helix domain-containing protein [Pleionea sp. CnH1-48]MCO7224932.1 winged helix-turn-helix domain-containing protein [Pleionea sp. CnH1-48]